MLDEQGADIRAMSGERADRVLVFTARSDETWELPVIGSVSADEAVLIRTDGHVAWAGDLADPGMGEAVVIWFGGPTLVTP